MDQHSSVRHYLDKAIEQELLDEVLRVGCRAASSGNMQFYSVVVTKNFEQKQRLYDAHMQQDMILQAPVLLTICADLHRLTQWMNFSEAKTAFNNEVSLIRGIVDAAIVAQNIVLAAEASGLGTCYMGTTLTGVADIVDILKLPKLVVPVTTVVMGYPAKDFRRTERLPMPAVIHEEYYEAFDESKIKAVYHEREDDYWQRFMDNPKRKQMIEDKKLTNIAQAYVEMKFKEEVLQDYSRKLWQCYEEQFLKG